MKYRGVQLVVVLSLIVTVVACSITIVANTGDPMFEILVKIVTITLLALCALAALLDQRAAKLSANPENISKSSRKLLKAITAVVIAMGIVAIMGASLWNTPMRASWIVAGIIDFAGGLILYASIRRNRPCVPLSDTMPPDMPDPTTDQERLDYHNFCVKVNNVSWWLLTLAVIAIFYVMSRWFSRGG